VEASLNPGKGFWEEFTNWDPDNGVYKGENPAPKWAKTLSITQAFYPTKSQTQPPQRGNHPQFFAVNPNLPYTNITSTPRHQLTKHVEFPPAFFWVPPKHRLHYNKPFPPNNTGGSTTILPPFYKLLRRKEDLLARNTQKNRHRHHNTQSQQQLTHHLTTNTFLTTI